MPSIAANLASIFDRQHQTEYERIVGDEAGLTKKLRRKYTEFKNCSGQLKDEQLILELFKDGASLECVVNALKLPGNWESFAELRIVLHAHEVALKVNALVLGREQNLLEQIEIPENSCVTLHFPLHELPLCNQSRDASLPLHTVVAVRLQFQWGDTWADEGEFFIAGNSWPATAHNAPTHVRIGSMELIPYKTVRNPILYDRYGQCIYARCPEDLVHGDGELTKARETEGVELAKIEPPSGRSRFGGMVGSMRFEKSGFFRVAQDELGHWWYVDPEGYPYWGFGFCCTNTSEARIIERKEHLYAELPDPNGPYASASMSRPYPGPDGRVVHYPAISFYHWNILRKYGSYEAWHDRMMERLTRWGVNSIGNWSAASMLSQRQIPHTRALMARLDSIPRVCRGFPDVFHPEWPAHFEARIVPVVSEQKDNPWLIGWFCDNEMPWGDLHRNAIFKGTTPTSPVIHEFVRFMRERFESIADFNGSAGTAFTDWDAVRFMNESQVPEVAEGWTPMVDFAAHFAERYFSVVSATIKKHDPNHLYLGCRFVRIMPHPAIVAVSGKYVDVLSVNCYDLWPREEQFERWHKASGGRPIQLGEFGIPSPGESRLRPNYPVFSQETIGKICYQMAEKWSRQPWSIGVHWFPWNACADELDRPHRPFVEAIIKLSRELPTWRGLNSANEAVARTQAEKIYT